MRNQDLKLKIGKFFKILGPGLISGAADDDPTAVAAYTQAGAQFGYLLSLTALFTIPFMYVIQEMCGRIGMVTGKGLSGVIRVHYSKKILYFAVLLLLITNTVNIGADLGAMAASIQLVLPLPFPLLLILLTVVILTLEIFLSYKTYSKYLKYLTLAFFAYIIAAFLVHQDWTKIVISTIVPYISFNKVFLLAILAILGTNISPYLFFWQSDEEVEEEVEYKKIRSMGRGVPKFTNLDLRHLKLDTAIGMIFSNIIVLFIGITAAATLGVHGLTNVQTAADAAQALKPLAGNFAFLLFMVGILGSGLMAVPVLAGSGSYAISEAFGWKEGLYKRFTQAHGFYGVMTIATLIGIMINFTPIKPIQMLVYAAALNAILAPFLIFLIIIISNNKKIMGEHTSSKLSNLLGITIAALMVIASIAFLLNFSS